MRRHRLARTATGTVLVAALQGLRDVLHDRRRDEAPVVADWAGDPPFSEPIVLRLDPDEPADSIAMVRPWLLAPTSPARR